MNSSKNKLLVRKNVPHSLNTEKGLLKVKRERDTIFFKQKKENEALESPGGMNTIHPAHENFNMVL